MAAVFWQTALLVELALAIAIGAPIAATAGGSPILLVLACAAALLLMQVLLVLFVTLLSRGIAGGGLRPLHTATLIMESAALLHAALRMGVHWGIRTGSHPRSGEHAGLARSSNATPVLLIHGILCNGGIWQPLLKLLQEAGFEQVVPMNLYPLFADIEFLAEKVVAQLRALQHDSGGRRVVIVAHSMGGLVARAALRSAGSAVIGRIVTLGTPHHGTAIACTLPCAPARQMCPDSAWLRQLNAEQEGRFDVPMTCLYSPEDTLVWPPSSAILSGARIARVERCGHLSLATSQRALRLLREELLRERP